MKRLLFLSIYMLVCSVCFAQTHAEKKFIRMAIGKEHIMYTSGIPDDLINELKQVLKYDTLFDMRSIGYRRLHAPDSLIFLLTATERNFIYKELDKMPSIRWKDNVVKHSILLDTIAARKYREQHSGGSYSKSKGYGLSVYTFTEPIFIRNNTVCFFYLAVQDEGYLTIYLKENKTWKLKYIPYRWIS